MLCNTVSIHILPESRDFITAFTFLHQKSLTFRRKKSIVCVINNFSLRAQSFAEFLGSATKIIIVPYYPDALPYIFAKELSCLLLLPYIKHSFVILFHAMVRRNIAGTHHHLGIRIINNKYATWRTCKVAAGHRIFIHCRHSYE